MPYPAVFLPLSLIMNTQLFRGLQLVAARHYAITTRRCPELKAATNRLRLQKVCFSGRNTTYLKTEFSSYFLLIYESKTCVVFYIKFI